LPYFGIAVFLRNGSGEPVTLERVRAVLGARSPLRQIGTRFSLFTPEVCTPGMFCQINWALGGFSAFRPFGAQPFAALRVPPGHTARGQLNFRIVGCAGGRRSGEAVSLRKIIVVYGLSNGTQIHQRVQVKAGFPKAVVNSTSAASSWTGTLDAHRLRGALGTITTNACQR